jgi:glycosyltransferase 2 family protein
MRAATIWLSGIVIGAAFLWFALRATDVRAVVTIVLQADKRDVLGIVLCALAFAGIKAVRWRGLLEHLRPVPAVRLIGPVLAGTAVNYGIPHGGELVRVWMVSRRERLSKATLLATIAVERLLDFCAALLLGLAALLAGHEVLETLGAPLWVLVAFVVLILGSAFPFLVWPDGALRFARALLRPLPARASEWTLRHLESGIHGLGSLQRGATLSKALVLSVAQWILMVACAWLSLQAVGVDPHPVQAVVTFLLLVVGLTLPTAPAHVGTTQVAFLLAAAPFGVGREEAIAASLVYNVFLPVPLIVIGIGVLLRASGRLNPPTEPERR